MKSLVDKLAVLLEAQADQYRSLLSILDSEDQALMASDLNELNEVNEKKGHLLANLQKLDKDRMDIMKRISETWGQGNQPMHLKSLIQYTQKKDAARLSNCRSDLLTLTRKIREKNDRNRFLFNHAIELVRAFRTLLYNMALPDKAYYRTGKIQRPTQSGRLISGAI